MHKPLVLLALVLVVTSTGCSVTNPALAPSYTPSPSLSQDLTPAFTPPAISSTSSTTTPFSPTYLPTSTATSTAIPATPTPSPPVVTYNADGQHAFPVAGDLALMTWTHYHWDGGNAVDVEAARRLPADGDEFDTFIHLPVVAVTTGTVAIADNRFGGLALLLDGQDGYTYYYGHLSEQWVQDGQLVMVGDWLGRIGNTGYNTQYIEPHLHFSIATHSADDWRWEPDVNAAERFLTWFDLPWQDLNIPDYPLDHVSGWPLTVPAEITRPFSTPLTQNPDQGSIDILPVLASEDPIPVYATLGGEVNVNRATVMGLRVQITNRPARTTVVYSFLQKSIVADGDVVQRGDVVGYVDPAVALNYMLFVEDVSTDPTATLGDAPWQ
jgi:murein DD-endopeptidase MepM/ murein hydrolase activator NlpD